MTLIEKYQYPTPFPLYLKEYFSTHKNLGSRDRKQIKAWFYAYFKSDFLDFNLTVEEELKQVLLSDFSGVLDPLKEHLQKEVRLASKFCFPLSNLMSSQVERIATELKREKLVWLRPLTENCIVDSNNIEETVDGLYGLKPNTPLSMPSDSFQIQDWASFMAAKKCAVYVDKSKVWDICCGAGGKAMTILDNAPSADYYASDIRPQIIVALKKRIGARKIISGVVDLSHPAENVHLGKSNLFHNTFDNIMADVPCSGSGTWGRDPQHLRFFNETQLLYYVELQRKIITNALPFLKTGGRLFYLTCSIYENENEAQLAFFKNQLNLQIEDSCYLNKTGSDTLFWAAMKKS